MADGVAEIKNRAEPALGFVPADDLRLDLTTTRHNGGQGFRVTPQQARHGVLQLPEQGRVMNNSIFDDLRQSSAVFPRGQGPERVEIAQHQPGLIKCADKIFSRLEIHAHLAADGTVHLRQQSGRRLHERNPAQVARGHKSGQIAHDPPAQRDDE